jgi:FkbM family methyltransferase
MRRLIYCGGHVGGSLQSLVDHFDASDVFEANPDLVTTLRSRFAQQISTGKLRVHHAAVGEVDGVVPFRVYGHDGGSGSLGVINPDAVSVVAHRWPRRHFDLHETVDVPCVNLHRWCSNENIEHIDLLVLDVQGMDVTVLETMEPLFSTGRVQRVQLEVDTDELPHYKGVPDNSISRALRFFKRFSAYEQVSGPTASWSPDEDHLQADIVFAVA